MAKKNNITITDLDLVLRQDLSHSLLGDLPQVLGVRDVVVKADNGMKHTLFAFINRPEI